MGEPTRGSREAQRILDEARVPVDSELRHDLRGLIAEAIDNALAAARELREALARVRREAIEEAIALFNEPLQEDGGQERYDEDVRALLRSLLTAPAPSVGPPTEIPGWEPADGTERDAQIVNGKWYRPRFGCDSLAMALEAAPSVGDADTSTREEP